MKGKVAIYTDVAQPMELREYPVPEPGPGEILVKVRMAGICGSDLHMWLGHGFRLPSGIGQVPGHEMMGEVYALGSGVERDTLGRPLRVGDRVAYAYFVPCGSCDACLWGDPACPNRYRHWIGVPADQPPHFHGAFGQFYLLRPGQWVFKVPEDLPDEVVTPVNCALSEVLYGLWKAGITVGDTVVIQGAGGLGLYATALAREMGAGKVIVVDMEEERLALAREFGADHTLNARETDARERVARVREWSGGYGADLVAELAGSPDILQEGLDMLRRAGRYLWIGNVNAGVWGSLQPETVVRYSRRIVGVVVYEKWVIPRALDFLARRRNRYPFHRVLSHTFPLEEINTALRIAAERRVIRAGLRMG